MKMPWEDDINWGNTATTLGGENSMVTTDKVTVAEFAPHIGKTTTDYKENDTRTISIKSGLDYKIMTEQDRLIAELISRVNSLEEDMEVMRKHIRVLDGIIF